MDQQQLSAMDPKLKEAYDRIMGNATRPVAQTADLSQTNPVPQPNQPINPNPVSAPVPPPHPETTQPKTVNPPPQPLTHPVNTNPVPVNNNQPVSPPAPQPFMDPVLADNQMHAYVAQEVAGVKQSLKVIQLMYIVGGLVFFAVYALFWMKFFNIPSPF